MSAKGPASLIVGLGELLWDLFPDGPRFGGAPMNFACSAAGLAGDACRVLAVSAVGRDGLGQQAIEELRSRGVDTWGIRQVDYPTGTVDVQVDELGHARYVFAADTAWDHLTWSESLHEIAVSCDAVCYGSLALRSAATRETALRFISTVRPETLRIFDVNLRPPHTPAERWISLLETASVVKCNEDELPVLVSLLHLEAKDERDQLDELACRFGLRCVALTRGASGSLLRDEQGRFSESPGTRVELVDPVGAGDAFTASLALGLLRGLPLDELHRWADQVASFVCSRRGATPVFESWLRRPS